MIEEVQRSFIIFVAFILLMVIGVVIFDIPFLEYIVTLLNLMQFGINFFFILLILIAIIAFSVGFILVETNEKIKIIVGALVWIHTLFTFFVVGVGGARTFKVLMGIEVGTGFIGVLVLWILVILALITAFVVYSYWNGKIIESSPEYILKKRYGRRE